MSAPNRGPMSVAEYLRSEEASPFKREYVGGFVYPLHGASGARAGTTGGHNRICINIVVALQSAARAHGCKTWKLHELIGTGSAQVPCLGRSLSLDEIYADVVF